MDTRFIFFISKFVILSECNFTYFETKIYRASSAVVFRAPAVSLLHDYRKVLGSKAHLDVVCID
jgi:hypothetical protein